MKTEQVVVYGRGDEVEKLDLVLDLKTCIGIVDLFVRQASLPQQGISIDAFTSGASICEPGDNARGAWWDMMTSIPEITHRSASKI
jgi:hypothetical protein